MQYSSFQQAIFSMSATTKSFVVNAVAGSGKTTTITEVAKRLATQGKSVLMLAFNKSIASELSSRMQGIKGVECKTLHAVGFGALSRYFGRGMKVDNRKWDKYIKANIEALTDRNLEGANVDNIVSTISKLLNLCRINLVKQGHISDIEGIVEHHFDNVDMDDMTPTINAVDTLLGFVYQLPKDKVVDYTDMITLPIVCNEIRVWGYDVVIIDEAQDLSLAQRSLMLACRKNFRGHHGRFIAVGDPKQSINGFAGADCESFSALVNLAEGNELPLSCCYRCDKSIIEQAQSIVPQITYRDGADEGLVANVNNFVGLRGGDMVLCRKTSPLVDLCLKMIASGISAQVKGRDIAEGLKKMIEKAKAQNIPTLFAKFEKEAEKRINVARRKGSEDPENDPSVVAYRDKIDCIAIIAEGCTKVSDVIESLDRLFADTISGNAVTLSTIHKAKGLESDRVWIVLPDKLPLCWKGQQSWEYEQEMNIKYVALTRAKHELRFVNLDEERLAKYQFNQVG